MPKLDLVEKGHHLTPPRSCRLSPSRNIISGLLKFPAMVRARVCGCVNLLPLRRYIVPTIILQGRFRSLFVQHVVTTTAAVNIYDLARARDAPMMTGCMTDGHSLPRGLGGGTHSAPAPLTHSDPHLPPSLPPSLSSLLPYCRLIVFSFSASFFSNQTPPPPSASVHGAARE